MDQAPGLIDGLLPYCGEQLLRLEQLGESHVQHSFGEDRFGRRSYRFNRLGYRGEESIPEAPHKVFAFGESHAFGYFVDFDQCWPSRFVKLWCERESVEPTDVNYLNFADPGTSNASIARAVVCQCSAVRPDLVLVHFADLARSEVVLNGRQHRIGPWLEQEGARLADQAARGQESLPETFAELIERGAGFLRFALGEKTSTWLALEVDPTCLIENLRSILLVQYFCKAQKIPLVATCEAIAPLDSPHKQEDPTVGPLARCLDREVICDFNIWSVGGDLSDDPNHAGPERHDRFARAMLDFHLRQGDPRQGDPHCPPVVR